MQTKLGDKTLLTVVLTLLVFGLVMIASAGVIYSETRFQDAYYFFKHQLFFGVLPGLAMLYFFSKIDYHFWKKIAVPIFFVSVIFLVLVFVPGIGSKVYGASRWLALGPFSFQPSEMAKLAIIIYLAAWLESRGTHRIKDVFEGLLPFAGIMGLIAFLIMKQPDTGTLGVIILTSFAIFFVSGARLKHLFAMGMVGLMSLWILIKIEPYRFNRILAFLDPSADARGIGYQISQALLAVGSGGLFGVGLGHSRQKFNYLPEPVGDSIFAVMGEELGLIGGVVLVMLFVTLASRGIKIAKNAPDMFGKLLATGITMWIVLQAFINISANIALVPLTGIPLPFISYGGTSLVFLMSAIGILLNISKQANMDN
ncbi:MAG: Stage V sporulation protein E [Candidatus Moranbacteria bacterium GW2011_GWE1_36_7]|nr:MAG: Stage V sporulation protein E [Candidatus Moranbacteria bacterium GW2011_GWD2_36_12]KKQ06491.1 MAG: Stage V sporulation protein E [Candidatus Moranbacteria bacterium GW2011_GWE2_36_40]KKQ14694.1 MAG: Stage V sporulation protein E [Candidatus Moranbacteria bacterium GW2011_GWE1_36_7]